MLVSRENIKKMSLWKFPKRNKDGIYLDLNENRECGKDFVKSLNNFLLDSKFNEYPNYDFFLKTLSKNLNLNKNEILLTNGADQAIEIVFRTFIKLKKVICPVPTFSYYQHLCLIENILMEKVFYENFKFPFKKILDKIDFSVDGILLCNPSNPLSLKISRKEIIEIIRKAKKYSCFVLIDEVYYDFLNESSIDLIEEYDNLIIIRSFSKAYGLAGLRLGYVLSKKDNIEEMLKVRGPWDVNCVSVKVADYLIKNRKIESKIISKIKKNKFKVCEFLKSKNIQVFDSYTNFITFKVTNSKKFVSLLKNFNIYVMDLSEYEDSGEMLKDYIRMGIPSSDELNKILKVFSYVLSVL